MGHGLPRILYSVVGALVLILWVADLAFTLLEMAWAFLSALFHILRPKLGSGRP
jgi:hypothetical protein